MAFERLVGLFVTNDGLYQQYREKLYPLLQKYGGDFGYVLIVSKVLKQKPKNP